MSEGDEAIANFVNAGKVNDVIHVLGTDRLWGQYGARSLPSWMTITASGETNVGGGSMPQSVINGDWISG